MENNHQLDPYQTPRANVEVKHNYEEVVYDDSGIFATSGRIGRLRYLAYSIAIGVGLLIPAMLIVGVLTAVLGEDSGAGAAIGMGLIALIYIAILVFNVILGVRRLHDLNLSGWMWLINLVPIIGTFFALYMLFAPGKDDVNDYGNPPAPNPLWVKIVAWGGLLVVPAIGILAALAIPAYQDYVERAQNVQGIEQSMDNWEAEETEAIGEQMDGDEAMSDAELEALLREMGVEEADAVVEGAAEALPEDLLSDDDGAMPAAEVAPIDASGMSQEEIEQKMEALLKELEQAEKEANQGQ